MADLPSSFSDSFQWPPDQALLAELRRLMTVLDALVLPAAQSKADYDSTVEALRQVILTRFNTTIQPIFDSIQASARLGAILSTTSVSTVTADLGSRAFIVKNGAQFAPAAYLMAQSVETPSTMLFGSVVSYDPNSGSLVINVSTVLGTLGIQRGNWRITAAATPQFLVDPALLNAYTRPEVNALVSSGDQAVTDNLTSAIDALRQAVAAVNATQDGQLSSLTTSANTSKSRLDALLTNVDGNYDTLRKISDALSAGGAASVGILDGRLQYTSTNTITFRPADGGDRIFINGTLYRIPANGVTVGPSGTANTIRSVYYQGSSGTLALSNSQPVRSSTRGYWALPGDDSWRHVGDVVIFSGPQFQPYYVVSRANRYEAERRSVLTGDVATSSTSPVVVNGNYNIGMLVAAGEDVTTEFVGFGINSSGGQFDNTFIYPNMTTNGVNEDGDPALVGYGNTRYPAFARIRRTANSLQAVNSTTRVKISNSGYSGTIGGYTTVRSRQ